MTVQSLDNSPETNVTIHITGSTDTIFQKTNVLKHMKLSNAFYVVMQHMIVPYIYLFEFPFQLNAIACNQPCVCEAQ